MFLPQNLLDEQATTFLGNPVCWRRDKIFLADHCPLRIEEGVSQGGQEGFFGTLFIVKKKIYFQAGKSKSVFFLFFSSFFFLFL